MDGRKPIPTKLKLLAGNPGKRPLNDREPKPKVKRPPCPAHLVGEARREYRRMGRQLVIHGLVTVLDKPALAAYCTAWAIYVEASGKLQKRGAIALTTTSPNGYPMQSPYIAIVNQALKQMRAFLVEFGMTPSSRGRVQSADPHAEEGDDLLG